MTEKLNIKQLKPISTDVNLGTSDALLPTQKAVKTYVDTADSGLQTQIDALSGRGRFLSVWNCATGLPETDPETSPYEYKSGDYFIVGVVSSADPAVNYKPDGSLYTTGVPSTAVETGNVGVDDVYLYDGTNWLLQINTQKTVAFSALAGSPYDNTNLGNALDAKADETNTINGAPLSNSETLFYGTSATAGLTAEKKVSIPSITTLKKGVVIFVKPDMTAVTAGITLKLNDFNAYPIHYNGAAISTTTDSIVWNQSYISIFVFDGTFWQFAGHGYDKDTTYSDATDSIKGIAKLYNSIGNNTDGSMTQGSITTALNTKVTANADITGATHTKITYDNKGLVTGGTDITLSDVTDITATAAEVNVLDGITATTTELNYVNGVTSNIQSQLDGKQATISDLSTIRSGAELGATAVQPGDNVSELVNDAGYLTQHQTLSDLGITATASEINVLDGITATTTELNYVDGVTSSIQTQIDGKQAKSSSAYNMGNSTGGWTAMSTAQQNALNSGATTTNIGQIATNTTNIANEIIDRQAADNGLQSQIDAIIAKSDVVDIVGTYAELQAYDTSGLGNNDVVKVISDSTHNNAPSYYRWVITGGVGAWVYIGSEAETYTKAETDALLNDKQDVLIAGSNITISGNTISATDTTYTGSDGITLTGTNFTNSGVRSVSTGSTNGTISVNTNGTSADVAVYGLGSAAYTASTSYATSAQGALADSAIQPSDLATVATTGDYDDLLNKPTIPAAQVNSDWNASSGVAQILNKPTLGTMAAEDASDYTPTSGLASVATTGAYSDLTGTPTIPTVNNPTITLTQGGVTKGSFTLNQSSGDTIELDAGGGSALPDPTGHTGELLTNDGTNASWTSVIDCGTMS